MTVLTQTTPEIPMNERPDSLPQHADRPERPRRPNVLLMIADDHRYGALRATGDPAVHTPVLDRLIAQGVSLDRNYHFGGLTGGVCVPARACLMAGANPFRALASTNLADSVGIRTIHPAMPTLPEVFRHAGYHTYHVGKWHNDKASFHRSFAGGARIFMGGMSDHYRVPVFDFDPTGEYPPAARYVAGREGDGPAHPAQAIHSTELFGRAAVEFLRGYDREEPFFLYVAFTAPHDPRTPPPEYAALYRPEELPLPPNFLPEHPFDNGDLRTRDEALAPWPRTPEVVRRHTADYYGMITHLDAWIGNILRALEEAGNVGHAGAGHAGRSGRGGSAETIVVYTADHGLAVGQHGLFGKQNLYEHSMRVPCILRGPGVRPSGRVDALTYTPDLYPTLCQLAQVPVPPTVETSSLVPLLAGGTRGTGQVRESVCGVYKDVQRMVCDGRWKLIRYYRSQERPGVGVDRVQLFDLDADPWETRDLAGDPDQADRLRRLASTLSDWQRQAADPMAGIPVLPT
jgi:arylsulfatase A-like enzyme